MRNLDRTKRPIFGTSETIMGRRNVAGNMKQIMDGFTLGVTVIMVEAVGNGLFRLFFNQSLTSWVTGTIGVGQSVVAQ
jgi:hypothetical protein